MTAPERPEPAASPALDVEIQRGGRTLRHVDVHRSPATIGRDPDADVHLESGHVSRLHVRIFFDETGVTLVDAGSTNGFTVRGRRLPKAKVGWGEPVEICGFVLLFRRGDKAHAEPTPPDPNSHTEVSVPVPNSTAHHASSDGWDEFDEAEEEHEPETVVKVSQEPSPAPALEVLPPADSVMNRVVLQEISSGPRRAEGTEVVRLNARQDGHNLDDDDDDDDDPDEAPPVDSRPLLLALHEEANAVVQAHPHGQVAVQVIEVVHDQVVAVTMLCPGEAVWWGGRPNLIESLWVVPDVRRFPMVIHTRLGEYSIQIPRDATWKMFHRGKRAVDVYRSGPFVGCQAEFDDQVEISCGPYATYVRCVRLAPKQPATHNLASLLPSPPLLVAAAVSMALHAGFVSLPLSLRRMAPIPSGRQDYFAALIRPEATAWSRPVTIAAATATTSPLPTGSSASLPPDPATLPPIAEPTRKPRGGRPAAARRAEPRPGVPEAAPTPLLARPPLKTVSVADFKVSGFLDNLPTVDIDPAGTAGMRSGPAALRGSGPLSAGVVTKGPDGVHVTPAGRLPLPVVKAVVSQHAAEIERCYNESLAREPGLAGRVNLEWTVDRNGVASNARATYDDVGSQSLVRCLRETIATWLFPPPKGGDTRVSFPFVFSNLRR